MKPPAQTFAGVFTDFKLVKTRNVAQVIVEVPIEAADQALATLGGLPRADQSPWVAVARLNCTSVNPPADAEKQSLKIKHWPMASQIHMRCQEPSLWTFFQKHSDFAPLWSRARVEHNGALASELAAEVVRLWCRVESRAAITPGSEPAERWASIEAEYEQWQRNAA